MEFGSTSTTCSMFIGGNEANGPDAVLQIPAGMLTTLDITSNYKFSMDEIRIADNLPDLKKTASSPPSLSPASLTYSVPEGDSGTNQIPVKVTLSNASAFDAVVKYSFFANTANEDDFVSEVGQLRFVPGETEKTIFVKVRGDTMVEPAEKFVLLLTGIAGVQISGWNSYVEVQIPNDDIPPVDVTLSIQKSDDFDVNWILSSTHLILQTSTDLIQWQNVEPTTYSDGVGPVKVKATNNPCFFRFGPVL